jgi:hypothetical protein
VIDGGEPMEFIALFKTWIDSNAQKGLGKIYTKGHIGKSNFIFYFLHMIISLSSSSSCTE